MRPRGELRDYLSRAVQASPGTTRDLAQRTGIGRTAAMYTLKNMARAGEVVMLPSVRVPGVKRPVPVYGPASAAISEPAGGINWDLVTCWAQWPRQA